MPGHFRVFVIVRSIPQTILLRGSLFHHAAFGFGVTSYFLNRIGRPESPLIDTIVVCVFSFCIFVPPIKIRGPVEFVKRTSSTNSFTLDCVRIVKPCGSPKG